MVICIDKLSKITHELIKKYSNYDLLVNDLE